MRYAEYKDIGFPWYPNGIPAHWETMRHKNVLTQHKELVGSNSEKYTLLSLTLNGVIIRDISEGKGKFSKDYDKYVVVDEGDLVFCLFDVDETPRTVGLSSHHGMITGAYDVFTPHDINSNFFYYYYLALDNNKLLKPLYTGLRKVIAYPTFTAMKFPVPPREEQDQIVRYLDWQLSKINKLIHGYQREIKLLEERKTAIINNAVTKGLNPGVEYKSVESNWTGDIPSHWDFGAIKQHFQIQKRIAGKEGYDVLSITQQGLKIKDVASNEGQIAASYANYQFVYPGDFAMNHMDLLTGYVGLSEYFGVTSPDYRVFTITDTDNCNPEYYLYIFQLCYKRRIFYGLGKGAASKGRWRMPAINFKNFEIPIPPMKEQIEIVAFIKEQEKKISELIAGIEKNIEALKEYRTRLISDVVTGQMDVRGIEIPEYTPEEDMDISDETEETDTTESEVSGDE